MITKQEVLNDIYMGRTVLDTANEDIGVLRYVINVLTYHLSQTLIGNSKDPAKIM
jgi:hypothetical protein